MDFLIQIKAIRMYFKASQVHYVSLSQRIVFTLTNSVDHDEMLHIAAFHLSSLFCLSTCLEGSKIQKVKLYLNTNVISA